MCVWLKVLCTGKNNRCQNEIRRTVDDDCGEHHSDMAEETTWRVIREGVCASCEYPSPPDSDTEQ
ncbi:hypothetical protein F4778DRAFT_735627 [Xylariomycetidae sp. FL2044]|nr:hypothetical protein F4778DRAFT_735627 [Xylariomycetidae sp. FL2044]